MPGRPPRVSGETVGDILVQVVTGEVDMGALPRDTPARVRDLLERCLKKESAERLPAIAEAREEIRNLLSADLTRLVRAVPERPVPNNLPARLTSFVGRESDLEACLDTLKQGRLLTLTGVGGAGKTRLAVRLAEELKLGHPDGAWFVDFGPLDDAEPVPQGPGQRDGVQEKGGVTVLEAVVGAIQDRLILIVLDNCEHLLEACRHLAATLLERCPGVRIVATSRERLGIPGEKGYLVSSLAVPDTVDLADPESLSQCDSVRLFLERATFVSPGFELTGENAEAVGEICRCLDGIPLAIELAAARVQVLSTREIQEKLEDRFRLLTRGASDSGPRHQTLAAAIDLELRAARRGAAAAFPEGLGVRRGVDAHRSRGHL